VSFLNQLKSQAKALQSQQPTAQVEGACQTVLHYLQDLVRQLNVIVPAAPAFSLDGKTSWPAMKLIDFKVDARKKMLRSREAFDYIGIARRIVNVVDTADHDRGQLAFRLMNANGFGILNTAWPAEKVSGELLDELAKLIVFEPQRFV